jgi:hypothetical protein
MLVGNFTPDEIPWEHIGQVGTLDQGAVEDFEDKRARHILTKFGPRGLLKVEWDDRDNLKKYTEKAMAVYNRFWQRNISVFNQQNEQRKNENKAYASPTKQLQDKADELGVELVEPWKAVKKTDSGEMKRLRRENEDLQEEMKDIKDGMKDMLELMKDLKKKPATPVIIDTASFLQQFNNLGKNRYQNWVIENVELIPEFPATVYETARVKWDGFYKEDDWPVPDCTGVNDL